MRGAMEFDFDYWADLARRDPEEFEAERLRVLGEVIARADPSYRRRLQGLQFQLDMERRRARTPLAACIRLSELMLTAVHDELVPLLNRLIGGVRNADDLRPASQSEARILPFPGKPDDQS